MRFASLDLVGQVQAFHHSRAAAALWQERVSEEPIPIASPTNLLPLPAPAGGRCLQLAVYDFHGELAFAWEPDVCLLSKWSLCCLSRICESLLLLCRTVPLWLQAVVAMIERVMRTSPAFYIKYADIYILGIRRCPHQIVLTLAILS